MHLHHKDGLWKQQLFILALGLLVIESTSRSFVNGENANNASEHEILLAPEIDAISPVVSPAKSPIEPQDSHDQPPQIQTSDADAQEFKNSAAAPLEIPRVESDRTSKPVSQQEPRAIVPRPEHAQPSPEIPYNWHATEEPTTEESEVASSGFVHGDEIISTEREHPVEEVAGDIEYASGSDGSEFPWESARNESATVNQAYLASEQVLDATNFNATSRHAESFEQTEVVYNLDSTTGAAGTEMANLSSVTPLNALSEKANNLSKNTALESIETTSNTPTEQPNSSTNQTENGSNSDTSIYNSSAAQSSISETTEFAGSSLEQLQTSSTESTTTRSDAEYELSQIGELKLLPSMAQVIEAAPTPTDKTKYVLESLTSSPISTNAEYISNTTLMSVITDMHTMGRMELVLQSSELNYTAHEQALSKSSLFTINSHVMDSLRRQNMSTTNWSTATMTSNHSFTVTDLYANNSRLNQTAAEGHASHIEFIAKTNPELPENHVVSEGISPTKSSDKDDFVVGHGLESGAQDHHASITKSGRSDYDAFPKAGNDSKKDADNLNKTQNPTSGQTEIHKDTPEDNRKNVTANETANLAENLHLATSFTEMISTIAATPTLESVFDSSFRVSELHSTTVLAYNRTTHWPIGNDTTHTEAIQPSRPMDGKVRSTNDVGPWVQPVTPAAKNPDHVLPTVKIPTTYLSMTMRCSWSYFCTHQDDLCKIFASHLTNATKSTVRRSQIVFFNINVCKHVSYSENEVNGNMVSTIVVQMYVASQWGISSAQLTERLGYVLVKNKLQGFNEKMKLQDVVMAVRLHKEDELPHTSVTQRRNDGNDTGIIAAITISGIAGICLVLLCILLVILKRRHILKQQRRRCRPVVADAYSLDSISIYSSFYKRKMRASKRSYLNQGFEDPNAPSNKLNFTGLAKLSTDENALAEEYKQIPMAMAKLEDLPPGADLKNRYANVIPFPETRVQLPSKSDDSSSGYINANYVRGFRGEQRGYIACQAPLESTTSDFWQMIWENQSKVIVMLTDWEEEEVAKCFPYFAESTTMDSHRRFGDFQVTTKKIDTRESFTISSLQLKNLEKNLMRDVFHYWFTAWPTVGVPNDRVSIVEMLAEARCIMRAASGPTVIHCSPGTGRTGTVLAIHVCMQEYETSRTVDIPQCVYRLRRDRGGCVQTSEQYRFIYEVIYEFASQLRNPSGRSSVRSSK